MIRLPPTSIGLSESDIHFHLRQVSVYQSLRAQGFNKEDIQRYYAEHQALKKACENECESPSERTASWGSADVLRGSVESEEFPTGLPPTPGFRCAGQLLRGHLKTSAKSLQLQGLFQLALPAQIRPAFKDTLLPHPRHQLCLLHLLRLSYHSIYPIATPQFVRAHFCASTRMPVLRTPLLRQSQIQELTRMDKIKISRSP